MATTWKLARRKPIFGIGSVAIPFIGLLIALFVNFIHGDEPAETNMYRAFMSIGIFLLALGVGAMSALVALARVERYWGIALAALIFDVWAVIWGFIHTHS